jgi:uncharacterized protein (TIGR00255 family)
MTGFARREGALGAWTWAVEARSVNGRNLEVRFRASSGFESLEPASREGAQRRFKRGQIGITLLVKRREAGADLRINEALLRRWTEAAASLAADGGATPASADGLLALRGVIEGGESEPDASMRASIEPAIIADIEAALDALAQARAEEGRALIAHVVEFLDEMQALATKARAAADHQGGLIRDRFAARLAELIGEAAPRDRIVQEAAVMAVRADVREELDRLGAHIASARLLAKGEAPAGRRLDFLAQEFMREANTLTAKSASAELTGIGLELKAAIDRLREQVQNVE